MVEEDGLEVYKTNVYTYYRDSMGRTIFVVTDLYKGAILSEDTETQNDVTTHTVVYRNMGGTSTRVVRVGDSTTITFIQLDGTEVISHEANGNNLLTIYDNGVFVLKNKESLPAMGSQYGSVSVRNNRVIWYSATSSVGTGYGDNSSISTYEDALESESYAGLIEQIDMYRLKEIRLSMGSYYATMAKGTSSEHIVISNYRMLVFTVIYPWLDYDIDSTMYVPNSFASDGETATVENVLDLYR